MTHKLLMAALAVSALAVPAQASVITLSQADLLATEIIFSDQADIINGLIFDSTDIGVGVDYEISLKADVDGTLATVGVGLADPSLYGLNDLTGHTSYKLNLKNINNDIWAFNLALFTKDGGGTVTLHELPAFTSLVPGSDVTLELDLTGIADLDNVVGIGFQVQGLMAGPPGNPSNGDFTHVRAVSVPEPAGLMLLLSAACVGIVAAVRYRLSK